jgi:hypothetical protein
VQGAAIHLLCFSSKFVFLHNVLFI